MLPLIALVVLEIVVLIYLWSLLLREQRRRCALLRLLELSGVPAGVSAPTTSDNQDPSFQGRL